MTDLKLLSFIYYVA